MNFVVQYNGAPRHPASRLARGTSCAAFARVFPVEPGYSGRMLVEFIRTWMEVGKCDTPPIDPRASFYISTSPEPRFSIIGAQAIHRATTRRSLRCGQRRARLVEGRTEPDGAREHQVPYAKHIPRRCRNLSSIRQCEASDACVPPVTRIDRRLRRRSGSTATDRHESCQQCDQVHEARRRNDRRPAGAGVRRVVKNSGQPACGGRADSPVAGVGQ